MRDQVPLFQPADEKEGTEIVSSFFLLYEIKEITLFASIVFFCEGPLHLAAAQGARHDPARSPGVYAPVYAVESCLR